MSKGEKVNAVADERPKLGGDGKGQYVLVRKIHIMSQHCLILY